MPRRYQMCPSGIPEKASQSCAGGQYKVQIDSTLAKSHRLCAQSQHRRWICGLAVREVEHQGLVAQLLSEVMRGCEDSTEVHQPDAAGDQDPILSRFKSKHFENVVTEHSCVNALPQGTLLVGAFHTSLVYRAQRCRAFGSLHERPSFPRARS